MLHVYTYIHAHVHIGTHTCVYVYMYVHKWCHFLFWFFSVLLFCMVNIYSSFVLCCLLKYLLVHRNSSMIYVMKLPQKFLFSCKYLGLTENHKIIFVHFIFSLPNEDKPFLSMLLFMLIMYVFPVSKQPYVVLLIFPTFLHFISHLASTNSFPYILLN